jgi:hypothetical protein
MTMQFQMNVCSVIVFIPKRSEMRVAASHLACIRAGKSLGEFSSDLITSEPL